MIVPFNDVGRRVAALRPRLDRAFGRTLDGGRFILGPAVESFEREFARFCGVRHAVGVASGTDALWLALEALGIGPGDEVITVANTCAPTVSAILKAGATPVLVDIDPEAMTMDPERAAAAVTRRTRVLLPVHLYGQVADLAPLKELARRKKLRLLEDCAQAAGAGYRGARAGSIGDAGAFSFYPTKNLWCLGDGGMVVTDDRKLAEKIRLLRMYGYRLPNRSVARGYNSRLDELQAALLLEVLPGLSAGNERRRAIARVYSERLPRAGIVPPAEAPYGRHSYHLYVARSPRRERFRRALAGLGVETAVHYPLPIHRQPGLAPFCRIGKGGLLRTEEASRRIVSLPMFPELTDREVERVAAAAVRAGR